MARRSSWSIVCLAICLALRLEAVRGADSPRWGGRDDRNMVSEEKDLPESFVPGKKRPDGSGIDLATTRERELGRPAGLADLRQAHGRRRPGLRRHQRRAMDDPQVQAHPRRRW